MDKEKFIFTTGTWLGEGKISLSTSLESIPFYTKWVVTQEEEDIMKAVQIVELQGIKEHTVNHFTFYDIHTRSFSVYLENKYTGRIVGQGNREKGIIAWEFNHFPTFEGFEKYELQPNGNYLFKAQYGPSNDYHTRIEGSIWIT